MCLCFVCFFVLATQPTLYLIIHSLLRLEEFAVAFVFLLFVSKKKPKVDKSTDWDSKNRMSVMMDDVDKDNQSLVNSTSSIKNIVAANSTVSGSSGSDSISQKEGDDIPLEPPPQDTSSSPTATDTPVTVVVDAVVAVVDNAPMVELTDLP